MTNQQPVYQSFNSDQERSAWIIEHANYYTVIRFHHRRYGRVECRTHEEAHWLAEQMVKEIPRSRYLIYAVVGNQSTYVETVG